MTRRRRARGAILAPIAAMAALCLLPAGAGACGYESPESTALGTLNFAYPDALFVGTAVW